MSCCSRAVFKCFKTLERFGDRVTGAAGPFFVGLAVILITTGTVCFFEIIMPTLSFQLITIPTCVLIAANLIAHYYYVCTINPGFVDEPPRIPGTGILWAKKRGKPLTGVKWTSALHITKAEETRCNKCGQLRPERAHHCRICNRCVLKYDHHCPWINQCVGIHNERHFVLFMLYLVISTGCFSALGYTQFLDAIGFHYTNQWPYYVPEVAYIMVYLLSAVLGLAVGVMLSYHLWSIARGETSVEGQDHEVYRRRAGARGEAFVNCYDVGKVKNLQLCFNIGDGGYPFYTLLLPLRIPPYTDGRSWAKKDGYSRHLGVRRGEELTDDEGEE